MVLSRQALLCKRFLDLGELLSNAAHRHEGATDDRHRGHDGEHRPEHEPRGNLR